MNNRSLNNCLFMILVTIVITPHLFLWIYTQRQRKKWNETIHILEIAKSTATNHQHYLFLNNRKSQDSGEHLIIENILNGMPLLKKTNMNSFPSSNGDNSIINSSPTHLELHLSNSLNDKEKSFTTKKNVMIDIHDLHIILKTIDQGFLASPSFFTTDFTLRRKATPSTDAIFDLQLSLLKRAP